MTDHVLELASVVIASGALFLSLGFKLFYSYAEGAQLRESVQYIKHTLDEIKAKL